MLELMQIPAWLGAAVVTGIITAIGYMAKQILDWLATARERKATRFARRGSLTPPNYDRRSL